MENNMISRFDELTSNQEIKERVKYIPSSEEEINSSRINSMLYLKQLISLEILGYTKKKKIEDLNKKNEALQNKINSIKEIEKPTLKKVKSISDFSSDIKDCYNNIITWIVSIAGAFFIIFLLSVILLQENNNSGVIAFFQGIKHSPGIFIFSMICYIVFFIGSSIFINIKKKEEELDLGHMFIIVCLYAVIAFFYSFYISNNDPQEGFYFVALISLILSIIPIIIFHFVKIIVVYPLIYLFFLIYYVFYKIFASMKAKKYNNKVLKEYEQALKEIDAYNKDNHEKNDAKWLREINVNNQLINDLNKEIEEIIKVLKFFNNTIYYNPSKIFASTLNKMSILEYLENGSANSLNEAIRFYIKDSKDKMNIDEIKKELSNHFSKMQSELEFKTDEIMNFIKDYY